MKYAWLLALPFLVEVSTKPVTDHLVTFVDGKRTIGWLDISSGELTFGGNIGKSAKEFFEYLKPTIDKEIKNQKRLSDEH